MAPTSSELREQPAGVTPRRSRAARWARVGAVLAAGVVLAVVGLRGRLPDPREFVTALTGAQWGWVALAALLQTVSLAAFAFQQRRLLADLGVPVRRRRLLAITLARSALSISLPAGAAVSTGYAIREYQKAGVPRRIGAASAIVSGLASIGGLALVYVVGGAGVVAREPGTYLSWRPLVVVAGIAALVTVAVVAGRRRPARPDRPAAAVRPAGAGRLTVFATRLLASARDAWQAGAGLRVRDWAAALAYAALNWLTDLLCLAAATRALGLPVGLTTLAGIYLGIRSSGRCRSPPAASGSSRPPWSPGSPPPARPRSPRPPPCWSTGCCPAG